MIYAQDKRSDKYWVVIEANATHTVDQILDYLKPIWYDCCGHLTEITGAKNSQHVGQLTNFEICYDMGSSSYFTFSVKKLFKGKKSPPKLIGKNVLPLLKCTMCKENAVYYCDKCQEENYEEDYAGLLCAACGIGDEHKCVSGLNGDDEDEEEEADGTPIAERKNRMEEMRLENENIQRVVNSPRFPICGWR